MGAYTWYADSARVRPWVRTHGTLTRCGYDMFGRTRCAGHAVVYGTFGTLARVGHGASSHMMGT